MMNPKPVSESRTEHVQILMPDHINGYKRLFGGKLMEWIDIVAGVVARRHAGCDVTTAAIDHLEFKAPAYVNDMVVLYGCITYVGKTSMEVKVDTFVEALDGSKKRINRAYLVLVALDSEHKPTPVPPLLLENEEQRLEWENAVKRSEIRKLRRLEKF